MLYGFDVIFISRRMTQIIIAGVYNLLKSIAIVDEKSYSQYLSVVRKDSHKRFRYVKLGRHIRILHLGLERQARRRDQSSVIDKLPALGNKMPILTLF
jgi:hypothetical protein